MAQNKKRIDSLDLLKTIGILVVVALHTPVFYVDFMKEQSASHLMQYIIQVAMQGVPLFLAVNGFLLLKKKELDINKHIRKTIKLFVVTIIWAIILTVIGMLLSTDNQGFSLHKMYNYIVETAVESKYTGVLWYMQHLIALYLIFPLIWHVFRYNYEIFRLFVIIMAIIVILFGTIYMVNYTFEGFDIKYYNDMYKLTDFLERFSFFSKGFIFFAFYFCLGGVFYHNYEKILEKRKLFIIVGFFAWLLAELFGVLLSVCSGKTLKSDFLYNNPMMIFVLVGMFSLCITYTSKGNMLNRIISSIGANTMGIYLSHYIFVMIVNRLWIRNYLWMGILAYILIFICSYLFSIIVKKIPGLRFLITM